MINFLKSVYFYWTFNKIFTWINLCFNYKYKKIGLFEYEQNILTNLIFGSKNFKGLKEVTHINYENKMKNICSYLIYKGIFNKEIKTKKTRKYGVRLIKEL